MGPKTIQANPEFIEIGIWSKPSDGEDENGDCYLVKSYANQVVIGVAESVGAHGRPRGRERAYENDNAEAAAVVCERAVGKGSHRLPEPPAA